MDWTPVNPLFMWLLRSPLHWVVSPGLVLLTITGRRTGREYTIPVGYQRDGELVIVLVSDAPAKQWWRNFREERPIRMLLRGQEVEGLALLVHPASEEFRGWAGQTFQRLPFLGRQFGIRYDRRRGLTDEQVRHLGVEAAIVRIAPAR